MKSVSEILKQKRLEQGFLIEDASRQLKIHQRYLRALEEANYAIFASSIQLKGFLRNYAEFLGLNKEDTLAFLRREVDEKALNQKGRRLAGQNFFKQFVITSGTVMTVLVTLLLLGFFSYVYIQYRSFSQAPYLKVESPASDVSQDQQVINIFGKTDKDATIAINGQQVLLGEEGSFATPVSLSLGLNIINITATNKLGKVSKVERKVLVNTAAVLSPSADVTPEEPASSSTEITLEVTQDASYLLVLEDAVKVFDGVVLSGVKLTFSPQAELQIKAGNAGVVRVTKNGEDLGVLGKAGEVVETTYTVDSHLPEP
ncbi:helix-turn-helix domain-containing protein [Candidatus Parcubacteria bacterium]|nr:helix-turn-helix domain-containing protein [Patescibacteria group bacterium]MBU4381018.1 helix-turn-helix domain-containing protein [Patescibacteria group bacterium]MCG2689079.1 helix-turn-helix domain-containing protein [Candidatus Parcubacteria bacterium]